MSKLKSYFEGKLFAKMGAQISITVLVLLALLFLFQAYKSVEADNKAKSVTAHLTSKSVLDKIDRNYYERFGDVQAFSVNKLVVNRLKGDSTVNADLQTFVNTMVQYYVLYDLMMICDINGNVIKVNDVDKTNTKINSQALIGKNFASSDWFTTCTSAQGPEGGAWYSDFSINDDVKQIYNSSGTGMGFAAPIKDENGTVIGVWYNFASWKEVTEGIRQMAEAELQQTTPNSYVVITQKQGSVIDANDNNLVAGNVTLDSVITASGDSKIKFNDSEIKFSDMVTGWGHSNGAYIYKGCQWNAITIIPKTKLKFSTFASVEMLPMILITLLIIGIAGYFFYKNVQSKVITKIEDLKLLLLEFSNGNLPQVSSSLTTNDEIGSIGTAAKTVSENLAKLVSVLSSKDNSQTDKEDIVVFNNQGIVGNALVDMRTNLKLVALEEKKRSWATEGMAKFGDILRNNASGLESLSNEIIINLVKYINGNQGGVFVVNDSNPKDKYLELTACYAWDKKKYLHSRIDEGEGLVGQAWQEGNVIYLTEVPANYIRITSGLGNSNPRSIIIIPLIVNDVTYGVIEIASFNHFEEYQIEFLKKLAESIASTISTAKINQRTKILLEQSQQQTEEMRAQEEEMRQNMEEMQATSEEAERKAMNYESAIARLNEEINSLTEELNKLKK